MKYLLLFLGIMSGFSVKSQDSTCTILGRTTGPLPHLEYGLGDDRLGGSKMTYLDTGILVRVVDSLKDDYKVQLSSNHFAWLPKINFIIDTSTVSKPFHLTASWRVYGDDKYDYTIVTLDEKLPYRSYQLINPAKIEVDIYGTVSNTNWVTQLRSAKNISNVYYQQVEDDVFRLTIELKKQQHWGYSIYYQGNRLTIRVKRQPEKLKLKNLVIAIDAGHGGSNSGAKGLTTNINEKDYTLIIAKEVEKALKRKKGRVFMTRTEDVDINMIDRTLLVRKQDPDFLLSIHLNSAGNRAVKGVSTYYRYPGFRPLSQYILDRMLELDLNEFGNIGSFNFALNGPTEYPNCLVEVAFLSNEEDEKRIIDPKFHKAVAKKIRKGVEDWLKAVRRG